jgi:hypothetical protein
LEKNFLKNSRLYFYFFELMASQEMPIFTRTFDFLTWLLPATNNFPRAHRNSATKRLLDAAFDLRERLEEANIRRNMFVVTPLGVQCPLLRQLLIF